MNRPRKNSRQTVPPVNGGVAAAVGFPTSRRIAASWVAADPTNGPLRLTTLCLACLGVAVALAAEPSVPLETDRLAFDSNRTGNYELFTVRHDGSAVHQLTTDDGYDSWWPRLSPDRSKILFYRSPKGQHDRDYGKTSLWVIRADGSQPRQLRALGADGWEVQGHAEWSPDGAKMVMFGGRAISPQIFITDAEGQHPQPVTSRGGSNLDPSWSPDGQRIIFVGCPVSICFPNSYEIYMVRTPGKEPPVRLTNDGLRDHDPYYSPDGTRIAWLTQTSTEGPIGSWAIRMAAADGTVASYVIRDENINSKPDWSRDGSRIYFHRMVPSLSRKFSIFSIATDGSDLQEVTKDQPGSNEYPCN